jgi:hypothetical protein
VRGWLVGLVIGLVVGAGAMYLGLRGPWGGGGSSAAPDAAIAVAPADAGVAKPKKKRRPPRSGTPLPGTPDPEDVDETSPVELTAADRTLEWRGDAVALPPHKVDMAGGGEARALEDSEINATVGNQTAGVRECVVAGATGTDLRATITIQLVVDGNGRVGKSRIQAPRYLFGKGLLACAQRALSRMRFPATGAPTLVTFPVNLG